MFFPLAVIILEKLGYRQSLFIDIRCSNYCIIVNFNYFTYIVINENQLQAKLDEL